jgi:uncharacterized phiE125 gp8 family phage protein
VSRSAMDPSSFDLLRGVRSVITTAPTVEPVTLDEAKDHLRRSDGVDDAMIESLIPAARMKLERDISRALITQTRDIYYDDLPCHNGALLLPFGNLQTVTSVKTYTTANVESTFSSGSYLVDTASEPARIVLHESEAWPTDLRRANSVIVRAVVGYGVASAVPYPLKQAMLLLIGAMYEHREQVIVAQFAGQFLLVPFGYDQLIAPYRLWVI